MTSTHLVDVAPERLAGWVERFTASHGPLSWSVLTDDPAGAWEARAQDGSWAALRSWRPVPRGGSAGPEPGWEAPPALLVVLARRGGYAVALVGPDGALERHKVGTRHVQSRTAAGGWSQQRFARRRGNQADALVEAVAGHTSRLLEEASAARGPRPRGWSWAGTGAWPTRSSRSCRRPRRPCAGCRVACCGTCRTRAGASWTTPSAAAVRCASRCTTPDPATPVVPGGRGRGSGSWPEDRPGAQEAAAAVLGAGSSGCSWAQGRPRRSPS